MKKLVKTHCFVRTLKINRLKKEFEQRQTREILDSLYGGSLSNFIVALTGGGKMTKEEAEELEDLLRSEKEK